MRINRLRLAATVLALAALGLVGAASKSGPTRFGQVDDARIANAAKEPQNWLVYSANQAAWRYSALDQINVDSIKDLKVAWTVEFDTDRGQESTPIVVDGVAYVSTTWSKVYAVDAKTGRQIWFFDPKTPGEAGLLACCDAVNRGVAVYKGKVYVGTLDGRLIAIDARTGKQVWSTMTVPENETYTITSAPRVGGGLIYIGNAGGEFGGRGFVSAYDAETGKKAWKFFLTPGKPGVKDGEVSDEIMEKVVQPTWFGPYTDYRGGANVWGSLIYDPDLKQVYLPTGNGFPWNRQFRSDGKGDNLFIASIVALDARTGKYKWHYQETPGDVWDFDAVADIVMLDLPVNGKIRKAMIHTPKAGYAWELDRVTGKVISGVPFVDGVTWTSGLDPKTGRPIMDEAGFYDNQNPVRAPGFAHSWQPTSYSPKTGYLYLQASQGPPGLFTPTPAPYEWLKGIDRRGIYRYNTIPPETIAKQPPPPPNPVTRRSFLLAWDPVKQAPAWKTDANGGGVLATGGNLVFQGQGRGSAMGLLNAYRADTGQKVWSVNTSNGISTGPMSYMVDGEQYVLLATGTAMFPPIATDVRARQKGVLVAFKLNGKGAMPADPPPAPPFKVIPADQQWPAADIAWAHETFASFCARCHGDGSRNNNVVPDLRRSAYLTSAEAWKAVVEDGALRDRGMIAFYPRFLPPGGAEKLRGYIADEARKAIAAPAAAAAPPPTPVGPPTEH